ncbi:hypothetical protein F5X96DRAFT_624766 [Biscogniauxia mediterranea]|nr:hypothetical protein F5X96DRAFT_624766 [Biscogniauxia mediterranea]
MGNVDVFDFPFFTSSNEYIPYESVMSSPEPGTPEVAVAADQVTRPLWAVDIKKYPHQLYVGRPFSRREDRDGESIFEFRSLFATAGRMYTKRREIAKWIEVQDLALAHDMLKAGESIKESGRYAGTPYGQVQHTVRGIKRLNLRDL